MKRLFAAALISIGAASAAGATTLSATFDTDAEGWTAQDGDLSWQATGGNGGGYIAISDANRQFMLAVAGSSFNGNLSAYDGGTLSFDVIQTTGSGSGFASFGTVRIAGGGFEASADLFAGQAGSTWTTASGGFDAGAFGVSQATWDAILTNVSSFLIDVENTDQVNETVGLDNVTLIAAVPLPAGGLLLIGALGGLAAMRRRRGH